MSGEKVNYHVALSVVNGECQFCKRTGFPILPVRYAVCQRNDANRDIPELSDDRVSAFTDIKLDKILEDGKTTTRVVSDEVKKEIPYSTSSQVNKYILRQLRSGYLYLFDKDNSDEMYWSGFAITQDGKYYQFPVKQPPSLDKMAMPCTLESANKDGESDEEKVTRVKNESLQASLVTITTPDKSGDVYYAFTEHAWPEDFLDEVKSRILGGDPWCDKYLQKFNVPSWKAGVEQDHAFSLEELDQVAEYSAGAAGLDEQFWSNGPKRDLYSPEEMKDTMSERLRYASTDYEGRGLILAVNDEIGIIQELNAYRHQALAAVEDFFHPGEDESSKRLGEERRRKMFCNQAINAFKKNYRDNYLKNLTEEEQEELNSPVEEAKEEQKLFLAREDVTKNLESADNDGIDARNVEDFNTRKRLEDKVKKCEDDREFIISGRYEQQINTIYDAEELSYLESEHDKYTQRCHALLAVQDSDYALWITKHLSVFMKRESNSSFNIGLNISHIVYNCLKGAILSPASNSLWQILSNAMYSHDSILLRAIFFNNKKIISKVLENNEGFTESSKLSIDDMIYWGKVFDEAQSDSDVNTNGKPKEKISENIVNITAALGTVINNSLISLVLYGYNQELNGDLKKFKPQMQALRWFVFCQQILLMSNPDSRMKGARIPLMLSENLKASTYDQILRSSVDYWLSSNSKKSATDQAFKSINEMVGNFKAPMPESDTLIKLSIPVFITLVESFGKNTASNEMLYDRDDAQEVIEKNENTVKSVARKFSESIGDDIPISSNAQLSRGVNVFILFSNLSALYLSTDFDKVFEIDSKEDLTKLAGTSLSLMTASAKLLESMQKYNPGTVLDIFTDANPRWVLLNERLGILAGMVSGYEGYLLIEESKKSKRNGFTITARNQKKKGDNLRTTALISTLAGLTTDKRIDLGATVLTAIWNILIANSTITYVRPAVQMWIGRSIVGLHDGIIQPFSDRYAEQNSFETVIQGLLVTIDYSIDLPSQTCQVSFNITLPKEEGLNISFEMLNVEKAISYIKNSYTQLESKLISNNSDDNVSWMMSSDHSISIDDLEVSNMFKISGKKSIAYFDSLAIRFKVYYTYGNLYGSDAFDVECI